VLIARSGACGAWLGVLRVRCTTRLIPRSVPRDFFIAQPGCAGELVLSPRFVARSRRGGGRNPRLRARAGQGLPDRSADFSPIGEISAASATAKARKRASKRLQRVSLSLSLLLSHRNDTSNGCGCARLAIIVKSLILLATPRMAFRDRMMRDENYVPYKIHD